MIDLRPLSGEHISPFFKWLRDEEVIKYSLTSFQKLFSEDDIRSWYADLLSDTKDYVAGIFLSPGEALIGYAGICNISATNKSGEYFIFIGDKDQWGKGIGTLTTRKILKYGFEELKLHRIMLTVSEPNLGGVRAYEKAGFIAEGKHREACYRDGKFHDKIIMSVLKSEFIKTETAEHK